MHHKQVVILFTALIVHSLAVADNGPSAATSESSGTPAEHTATTPTNNLAGTAENVTTTPDVTTTTPITTTSISSTHQVTTLAGALLQMPNETCDALLIKMRAMVFVPEVHVLNGTSSTTFCSSQWSTAKQYKENCMKSNGNTNEVRKFSFYLEVFDTLCASNQSIIGVSDGGNKCFSSLTNVTQQCTNGSYSYPSEIGVARSANVDCANVKSEKNCIVSGLKEHCNVDQQKALGSLIDTIMTGKCDNNATVVSTTSAPTTTTKPRNSGVRLDLTPFALLSTIFIAVAA